MSDPLSTDPRYVAGKPLLAHKAHTLRVARGPGSIHAEADMRALVVAGKVKEAIEFWEHHHSIRGARPMTWGESWYTLAKAGDPRARGVT